jgi:hypothetical protein
MDSPFMLRPIVRAAPPGFPPDVAPNQIIYAAHINAIRDSVAVWPGNVSGNGKTLHSVGSIGIGTASPEGPLHLAGVNPMIVIRDQANRKGRIDMNGNVLRVGELSVSDIVGIDLATANVGIGTMGPGSKLDVVSAASIDGLSLTAVNRTSIWFKLTNGVSRNWLFQNAVASADDFQFLASPSAGATPTLPVMVLRADARVGIGTTNPESAFHLRANNPVITLEDFASSTRKGKIDLYSNMIRFGELFVSDLMQIDLAALAIRLYLGGGLKTLSVDGSGFVKAT